jgi:hypothetical protein
MLNDEGLYKLRSFLRFSYVERIGISSYDDNVLAGLPV